MPKELHAAAILPDVGRAAAGWRCTSAPAACFRRSCGMRYRDNWRRSMRSSTRAWPRNACGLRDPGGSPGKDRTAESVRRSGGAARAAADDDRHAVRHGVDHQARGHGHERDCVLIEQESSSSMNRQPPIGPSLAVKEKSGSRGAATADPSRRSDTPTTRWPTMTPGLKTHSSGSAS